MAVVIRLTRIGSNKRPAYRLVACDSRRPRDGAILEKLGDYDPRKEKDNINLNKERIVHWMDKGAKPSQSVLVMLKKSGIIAEWRAAKKSAAPKKAESGAKKA